VVDQTGTESLHFLEKNVFAVSSVDKNNSGIERIIIV
jgi:hypothetical protein